ncbi:MAG: response regulator [Myxococcales bacterium]|nr:response regulator [Myxococcales bacterium]
MDETGSAEAPATPDVHVTEAKLAAFALLSSPIWLVDIDRQRLVWANRPARALATEPPAEFDAPLAELYGAALPLDRANRARLRRGELANVVWAIAGPRGPETVSCLVRRVQAPEGAALLVEGRVVDPRFDVETLRAVEAMRHAQLMISVFSDAGVAIAQNPAASRTFGPPALGDSVDAFARLFHDPDDLEHARSRLARNHPFSAEVEVTTLRGRRWHRVDARAGVDPVTADRIIVVSQHDVSDRKKLELKLGNAGQAEDANKAKSRLLATMSHEIRTALTAIQGMTELLGGTTLSPEQSRYINVVQQSAKSLLQMLNDALDLDEIESGKLELINLDFSLPALVQEVVEPHAARAEKQGLDLRIDIDPRIPTWIRGDPGRLATILDHLLTNSLKFTERGGIRVHVTTEPHSDDHDDLELTFEVTDSGIGMSPEQQARMLSTTPQDDGPASRRVSGPGLGLALCKRLVEAMGGQLGVVSTLGVGSTIRFYIVVTPGRPDESPRESWSGSFRPREGRALRVLVAEDNRANQMLMATVLRRWGHEVDIVGNGRLAVEAARAAKYDIAFMDMQMPEMDGVAATRGIRALPGPGSELVIIGLTADVSMTLPDQFNKVSLDDCLVKPFEWTHLQAILARVEAGQLPSRIDRRRR